MYPAPTDFDSFYIYGVQHSGSCLKSCSLEHSRELYIEKSIETQLCKHDIPYSVLKFNFLENHSVFKLCMFCITKTYTIQH